MRTCILCACACMLLCAHLPSALEGGDSAQFSTQSKGKKTIHAAYALASQMPTHSAILQQEGREIDGIT